MDKTTHVQNVVHSLWGAVAGPDGFDDLVEAWDIYETAQLVQGPGKADPEIALNFARASLALTRVEVDGTQASLDRMLSKLADPALVLSADGTVEAIDPRLSTHLNDDDREAALRALVTRFLDTVAQRPVAPGAPRLVRLPVSSPQAPALFLAEVVEGLSPAGTRWILRLATVPWRRDRADLMAKSFGLTGTELSVLELLYSGLDAAGVAAARNRSVLTARTQIKTILAKTGAPDQRELVRLVAAAMRVETGQTIPQTPSVSRWTADRRYDTVVLPTPGGGQIELCRYGAMGGNPVLFIQPTTVPIPEVRLAALAEEAGLDIISPYRPGSGRSSPRPATDGPAALVEDYLTCLDHIAAQSAVIAGHCSGGLYAITLAAALGQRARGVLTLDTGPPLKSIQSILKMPPTARRTFAAMRYAPAIMLAPHKMVANKFFSGPEGEAEVMSYFFRDNHQETDAC